MNREQKRVKREEDAPDRAAKEWRVRKCAERVTERRNESDEARKSSAHTELRSQGAVHIQRGHKRHALRQRR